MSDIAPAPQNAPGGIPIGERVDPEIAAKLRGQIAGDADLIITSRTAKNYPQP